MRVLIDDVIRSFDLPNTSYVFHEEYLAFKKAINLILSEEQLDLFYGDDTKRIFNVPIVKIKELEKQFSNYKR